MYGVGERGTAQLLTPLSSHVRGDVSVNVLSVKVSSNEALNFHNSLRYVFVFLYSPGYRKIIKYMLSHQICKLIQ